MVEQSTDFREERSCPGICRGILFLNTRDDNETFYTAYTVHA